MKLVELLARELNDWPDSAAYAMQDNDKEIRIYSSCQDPLCRFDFYVADMSEDGCDEFTVAGGGVKVTRAQWQAERDRQKGGEWKRHRAGRNQPVNAGVRVEVKLRCGDIQQGNAHEFIWLHSECDVAANIMQYRIVGQPQAEEVEVKDTTIGTLSYKVELDTSPAMNALNELSAKWDQVESPLKWRDEVTELNAYIEKFTRERDSLIERLASEGFALIPPVVSVVSEFSGVDMSDWRNWKRGDVIEMIADDWCDLSRDERYTIISTNDNSFTIIDDCDDKRELSVDEETVFSCGRIPDFKFIKRG